MIRPGPQRNELHAAFSQGRWTQDLPTNAWAAARQSPDRHSIGLALDVQHAMLGIQQHHIAEVDALMQETNIDALALQFRLASAEALAGCSDAVFTRLAPYFNSSTQPHAAPPPPRYSPLYALRQYRVRHTLSRYPSLLALIHEQQPQYLPTSLKPLAAQAAALVGSQFDLSAGLPKLSTPQETIEHRRQRIAVVGNGPNALGTQAGNTIDAAGTVIRFNNAVLTDLAQLDVGTRTDLWVVSPALKLITQQRICDHLILTGVDPLSRPSRYWRHLAKFAPASLSCIPRELWYRLVQQLEAPPSAGVLTLAWLDSLTPQVHASAYGFTALSSTDKRTGQANHYGDSVAASSRHNWSREATIVSDLLAGPLTHAPS